MIIAAQIRAARALLGIDQRQLADLAGVSLPTVQRMEAASGEVRGTVDKLMRVIRALEGAGVEILGDHAPSAGAGRGVRLRASGVAAGRGTAVLPDQPPLQGRE
jgi:transcriptional regulator with XRE-family HTH domain